MLKVKDLILVFMIITMFNGVSAQSCNNYVLLDEWGTQGSGDGEFTNPWGIAGDGEYIYMADFGNNRIQKFWPNGTFVKEWGTFGSGDGELFYPTGIVVDSSGNVYVSEYGNDRISKFDTNGAFITRWGSYGSGDGQFRDPYGIAVDSSGNVYTTEHAWHRVQKFWPNGTFIKKWGSGGSGDGQFINPLGIVADSGFVYVADGLNHRIQKFDTDGGFISKWGTAGPGDGQFRTPVGIAVDSGNNVFTVEQSNARFQKFWPNETFITKMATGSSLNADVFVDNDGIVYVSDYSGHRIRTFGCATVCGNGIVEGDEECDGGDCCTDSCTFESSATECRASAGACDIAETCTGTSADCPTDDVSSAGTECRASAGGCDVAETCDGSSVDCPADAFQSPGTWCNLPLGDCDKPEVCDGSGPICPDDSLTPAGTVCRPSAGDCDIAEACDGSNVDCPDDGFASSSTECRASAGECDIAETCDGSGTNCPADQVAPSGTACGDPNDTSCDNPDTCDGAGTCNDNYEPSGTDCSNGLFCDGDETCDGSGNCPAGIPVNCPPGEICDDSSDTCSSIPPASCPERPNDPQYGFWDCGDSMMGMGPSAYDHGTQCTMNCEQDPPLSGDGITICDNGVWIGWDDEECPVPPTHDFGDAPESYSTLLPNGPSHQVWGTPLNLGVKIDREYDGQPSADALGDDNNGVIPDDEEGVTFLTPLVPGEPAQIKVIIAGGLFDGKLDAWIDFDGSGTFDHPVEHLFGGSLPLINGPYTLSISVPHDALPGYTYARFRLSSSGNLEPTGEAQNGEVEDYMVEISPQLPTCDDGIQNGDETGVDCGGSCPDACQPEPIPEFPAAALPALVAASGYLALRMKRRE